MADVRIALRDLLRKYRDDTEVDALKEGLVLLVQELMEAFRNRPLGGEYPYVGLEATVVKVREGARVVNMAAVVAVGVTQTGEREVLGFNVGAAESYGFWVSFLRGLSGIQASFVRGPGGSLEGKYPKAVDGRLTGAPPQEPEVPALGVPKEVIAV